MKHLKGCWLGRSKRPVDALVNPSYQRQPHRSTGTIYEMALSPSSAIMEHQFSEEAVKKLAKPLPLNGATWGPRVIRNLPPAKHTPIQRNVDSHMGSLSTFPVEILSFVLDSLDFQSLSCLSQTSLLARNIVEQLPAYNDMMSYAPETLTALKKIGLLSYHSASQLRRALHSEKCVSCTQFGGYLFLPTCERACYDCLNSNHSLRVTTRAMAKRCFLLSDSQLRRIPIMLSIPDIEYRMACKCILKGEYRLVSVRQAKELAIKVHGSAEALETLQPKLYREPPSSKNNLLIKHFREAPLVPSEAPFDRFAPMAPCDDYGGMDLIRFPTLRNGELDFGTLCRGCEDTFSTYQLISLLPGAVSLVHPAFGHVHPRYAMESMRNRLWSKTGFPQHIKECCGVGDVLED